MILAALALLAVSLAPQDAPPDAPAPPEEALREPPTPGFGTDPGADREAVRTAARVIGLELTDSELELMTGGVIARIAGYRRLQGIPLDNAVFPALVFEPLLPGVERRAKELEPNPIELPEVERPDDLAELAFADVPTLASLVRSRKVSCVELAELALARLVEADETLHCVISLCEERAMERAEALDRELDEGHWRGLLHGIPYGAKDLFAAKGTRTTWGAKPFEDQVIGRDAAVIRKLEDAGAVLVAKLSLGALAMGDVWFGGTTRNPWQPSQGSSGSSAGSAAAVAAGCVPFALGTETLGSIVSPSARCGNSSLRPTFGRVSRDGAMALSWSMDKIGPLCRSLQDAAIVFDAIRGADGLDPSARDAPFHVSGPVDVTGWRVGYEPELFERAQRRAPGVAAVLDELKAMGCELVPIELPDLPTGDLMVILEAEAATAFDELTRSGRDDELTRQSDDAWPNSFRKAQLVPAVEYLRANRVRTELCRAMDRAMAGIELYVHPSFGGASLAVTNLTGHPTAIAPCGFREDGTPYSICFTGQLYGETRLLALAEAWQARTEFHRKHPAR